MTQLTPTPRPLWPRFAPALVCLAACLAAACSGVPDEGVGADAGNVNLDASGELDAALAVDTLPPDAAACPGATGCACDDDAGCASGACVDGVCGLPCTKDCDDQDPCTVDLCVAATAVDAAASCDHTNAAAGTPCSDGTLCTQGDACSAGACKGTAVDCDDQSVCTVDWCHPAEGCKHDEVAGACDDGDACTVGDVCVAGGCAPGQPQVCEDGNPCTTDTCDAKTGCKQSPVSGGPCDDGDACSSADTCKDGACAGGAALNCDDGKPCTQDTCDPGAGAGTKGGCVHAFADAAPCDDGSACTIGDSCKSGVCVSGKPQPCDDGNPCTEDACDAKAGCTFKALGAGSSCDDGNACTTGDGCDKGVCSAGAPLTCDDGNACTQDTCDVLKGCVSANVDGGKCVPAGNSCTVGGLCTLGACKPVAQVGCDDGQPCTTDTCDKASGKCLFAPLKDGAACNDGAACTGGDSCKGGKCVGGKVTCDDNSVCTADSCDGTKGCVYTALPNAGCSDGDVCTVGDACKGKVCVPGKNQVCDDNNPCTSDGCDQAKGCDPTPNTAPCDDGDLCTTADSCVGGACKGGKPKLCDDGNPCTIDVCQPNGPKPGCQFVNDDKSGCSDGNVCTTGDVCTGGKCIPGKAQLCDDQNVCTQDLCDPKQGCVAKANTASCSDYDVCTVGDTCKGGKCVAGPYQNCDDGNPCTVDSCDPKTGCTHAVTEAKCDDGNACTVGDGCLGGKCIPGKQQSCDDANACTNDGCDTTQGCVNPPNTAPCDDGNACSLGDLCSKGGCVAGPKTKECDDLDVCTQDLCYPGKGCQHLANTAPCDDGNACTTSDNCAAFKCVGGPKLDCNDQNLCTNDACNPKTGCVHVVNGNKPFAALSDDASSNSGKWEFKASSGPVRFTHAGTGWYQLSAPQNGTHTMTLVSKVDLSCAFNPTLYFVERYNGGSHWVEVSADGGKTWSAALIRGGKSDYVWRRQALDLKGFKGKKVQVRFRALTTSTSTWWNIRDIALTEADKPLKSLLWGAAVDCDDIATEGPAWACNTVGGEYELNFKGSNLVPDPNLHINTATFRVRFDVTKNAKRQLTFEERFYYGIMKVEARTQGSAWAEVYLRPTYNEPAWRKREVDLSDFKGDEIELRFTVRTHHSSTKNFWGDVRRITFGTKPAPKADSPFGSTLKTCSDWALEDTVWECDPTAANWRFEAKGDTATTKHANGATHYATFLRKLDLTQAKAPVLRFEHNAYYGSRTIQIRPEGGNWTSIWTQGNYQDPIWRDVIADLGQFLGKKVWLRLAYTPHNKNYRWWIRKLRTQETPKALPVVPFKTPAHDCGSWLAENATWQCDPSQATYQFRYAVPQGMPTGYGIALTNQTRYDLAKQANPHVQLTLRRYHGSAQLQASVDGVQWDTLWSGGNLNDPVWRTVTLPLTAYKDKKVQLRLYVVPHSPSYWGEFKDLKLVNPTAPQVVTPAKAFGCAAYAMEGEAWTCKTTADGPLLRYTGGATQINTNGYNHYATTTQLIDLAKLKAPVLRAEIAHYYGEVRVYASGDGEKWHELGKLPNANDQVFRKLEWSLGLWTGQKVFVRFGARPNNAAYWGEVRKVSVGEYVAPGTAKVGDPIQAADLTMEGGWHYDLIDKRYESNHTYVNHYQSLALKRVYNFTGATKPVLRFEHAWLYGYQYVDVSLDGKAWKTLWYQNTHGKRSEVMRPQWVDLSELVGKSGVRFRFRHYSYNYPLSSGGFWGVNQIAIEEYKAPTLRKAPTTLTSADLQARGLWTVASDGKTWSLNTPPDPQASKWVNSEHFLWPKVALDFSALSSPVLRLMQRNSGVTRYVDVSVDDGQVWEQVGTIATGSALVWQEHLFDLSQWKKAKSVLVRLRGNLNNASYFWQVRDLAVIEKPTLKGQKTGYEAKLTDWTLESGWNTNAGLNLLERKLDAIGVYTNAETLVTWDLSNAPDPKLVFDNTYGGSTRKVFVSIDGVAWDQVLSVGGGTQSQLKQVVISLAKYKGAKALRVRLSSHLGSTETYWRVKALKVVAK